MSKQIPRYIGPEERDYSHYNDHLIAFNRKFQNQVSNEISSVLEDCDFDLALATAGSDARLEKGPNSQIELILIGRNHANFLSALDRIQDYISQEQNQSVFYPQIEVKNLEKGGLHKYTIRQGTSEETQIVSPNRVFDLRMLFERNDMYFEIIGKFINEIKSPSGRSILKRIKKRARDHSLVAVSGVQRYKGDNIQHYDYDSGIVSYDPDNNLWSFKQGPLRTVQYALVRDSIKRIRDGINPEEIFFLPKNTVEKLNRGEVEGMTSLGPSEIGDLTDSYKYFLHLYHKSQATYKESGETLMDFDTNEVRERNQSLAYLCSKRLI